MISVDSISYSFDQFLAHGLAQVTDTVNGMAWSFEFHGYAATHENDNLYLLCKNGETLRFNRDQFAQFDPNRDTVTILALNPTSTPSSAQQKAEALIATPSPFPLLTTFLGKEYDLPSNHPDVVAYADYFYELAVLLRALSMEESGPTCDRSEAMMRASLWLGNSILTIPEDLRQQIADADEGHWFSDLPEDVHSAAFSAASAMAPHANVLIDQYKRLLSPLEHQDHATAEPDSNVLASYIAEQFGAPADCQVIRCYVKTFYHLCAVALAEDAPKSGLSRPWWAAINTSALTPKSSIVRLPVEVVSAIVRSGEGRDSSVGAGVNLKAARITLINLLEVLGDRLLEFRVTGSDDLLHGIPAAELEAAHAVVHVDSVIPQLPEYQCFKKVRACHIVGIRRCEDGSALLLPADGEYPNPIKVSYEWLKKHTPVTPGYLVAYEDGYRSWSPVGPFEAGYAKTGK